MLLSLRLRCVLLSDHDRRNFRVEIVVTTDTGNVARLLLTLRLQLQHLV